MAYIKADNPTEQKHFDFLEDLRQSGEVNMLNSAPYLYDAFPDDFDDVEPKRGLNQGYQSQKANDTVAKWRRLHYDPTRRLNGKIR